MQGKGQCCDSVITSLKLLYLCETGLVEETQLSVMEFKNLACFQRSTVLSGAKRQRKTYDASGLQVYSAS